LGIGDHVNGVVAPTDPAPVTSAGERTAAV